MAKIVYLIARKGSPLPFGIKNMERVLSRLSPDNIVPAAPRIIKDKGILIGIFNPVASLPVKGLSVCLGAFFSHLENWWEPCSKVPDGSFALFRTDGQTLEVATDIVASRTIWYVQTPDLFIASTSQRAIVCFLQSYQPNTSAISWMLSSGTLGPGFSWDNRIHCLTGDSRLILDRSSWKMKIIHKPVIFSALKLSFQEHQQRLLEAMKKTFEYINPKSSNWILPLSGGYDSRAILLMIKNRSSLKTITWGLKSALKNHQSDAWVARELANRVRVEHEYFETDLADEPVSKILNRFLIAGEGRIDHISGYMDGFAIWKWLYRKGYQAILRGDEAFGCRAVKNDHQVQVNMSMTVLSDFENTNQINFAYNIKNQRRPETLERKNNESREQWRDRVNTEFEIPFVFAALSDLKLSYIEIIQPLLSRKIVEQVRLMPDEYRTNKTLFKKMINQIGPQLKYAKYPAIESRSDILMDKSVVDSISKKLQQNKNKLGYIGILSRFCLEQLHETGKTPKNPHYYRFIEKILKLPRKLRGEDNQQRPKIDPYHFAFRVYIIAEMANIFYGDASDILQKNN